MKRSSSSSNPRRLCRFGGERDHVPLIESHVVDASFDVLDGLIGKRELDEQTILSELRVRTGGLEDEVVDSLVVEHRQYRFPIVF